MDSARQNLASSFVNGFVNAAFGKDKLLTEDGNKWLYKHNDHGTIFFLFLFFYFFIFLFFFIFLEPTILLLSRLHYQCLC